MIDTLSVRVALRFLKSSKAQTLLIIIGLGIGIAVQVFVGSLLQNLQQGFINELTGNSSHITVLPDSENVTISDWEFIIEELESVDDIKAVSASADLPGLLTYGKKSESVQVRGFIFSNADKIYEIEDAVYEGRLPSNESELLLGKELVDEWQLSTGDRVDIITADQRAAAFYISGMFDLGTPALNERWVMMTLAASQQLFMLGNNVTSIEMQVGDVFGADKTAAKVAGVVPSEGIAVINWIDENPDFFSALNAQGASSYMIQTFVLMSVIIGIASVLSISVVQKSRQIGILKAMGIKDRAASQIFMFQGLFLGIGGALIGVILGSLLFYGFVVSISSGGDSIIETNFNYAFIIGSGIVAVLSAVFASILPAVKSSRLDPMEVIRNG